MFAEEMKPFVLTIHGIRTKGEWQESAAQLFQPFYRTYCFKHDEFRHPVFSVLWLGLQVIGSALGLAVASFILIFWRPFANWLDWLLAGFTLLSFWLGSGLLASHRLDKVAGKFAQFWGQTVAFREPPHIVAHSLGTFMTGICLAKHEGLRAEKIILNGCVLERGFPWREIKKDMRVAEVRNEIACKDWVSRTAFFLHGFVAQMGHAGVSGFHSSPLTRTWQDPHRVLWYCENGCTCATRSGGPNEPTGAFVHNVVHRELSHNDVHLGPAHAMAFWLPGLWGIPSLPFVQFRDQCIECRKAELAKSSKRPECEAKLRSTCWGWTEGPLENRVRRQLEFRLKGLSWQQADMECLVSLSVRNLWTAVAMAVENRQDEKWAVNLFPEQALLNAIEATVANCSFGGEEARSAKMQATGR